MTLPTTISTVTYAGNGITTQFDWTFPIPSGALAVYRTEDNVAVLVDPSAYSVSGLDDPNGGTVTFAEAPALGQTITIKRNVVLTQDVALVTGSAFYAEVVEGAFDHATMQIQQLAEEMGRAVQVPIGSGLDPADYLDAAARSAAVAQSAANSAAGSAGAAATAQSGSEAARDDAVAAAAAIDEAMASLSPATTTTPGISREATTAEAASGVSTTPAALPHVTPEGVAAALDPVNENISGLDGRTEILETVGPPKLSTASGLAPSYSARAAVSFNGITGALNSAKNVSSVTVQATGTYAVNFATALPNADYCWVASLASVQLDSAFWAGRAGSDTKTNSTIVLRCRYANGGGSNYVNAAETCVAVF